MLGDRLKALRLERGMTLKQLSEVSGLSVGMLSQIENGTADPSLGSLRKLAGVFEAAISSLFTDPDAPLVHVSSPNHRPTLGTTGSEFFYERLTPGRGDLEMLTATIPPGRASSAREWAHPSTECAFVISGELRVEIGEAEYTLTAGESITFDSRQAHRYVNASEADTSIVIAVTPPTP
ncbi:cupin domain-containing protein [Leifsonia sp. PS1209]|uniref:cupin domain-containing protein n=1 Tax=Leifsonia sp. PS1209 TaxID=2724914 RepID=UPI001442CAF9|nr:cupin domain-containing protein [Leifsonia sp. PS1209]QJA00013.1 cupin domain-containing protein [Leifsonia sp. PS1209]